MATVYKSKIDWWFAVTGLGVMAASVLASINVIVTDSSPTWLWWTALLTAGIGVGLPLWLLLGTDYALDAKHLHIKSGPFRWQVAIADITRITPSSSPLSSPALSLDRLRIDYGRGASIMISPRDKERFIREIEALRRDG
ncbi:MAG: PH domain-containing protein [Rhodocyclaceae bacterium]|nr:PH domain-containing protein [Rhodocyclaceae bacterium]